MSKFYVDVIGFQKDKFPFLPSGSGGALLSLGSSQCCIFHTGLFGIIWKLWPLKGILRTGSLLGRGTL